MQQQKKRMQKYLRLSIQLQEYKLWKSCWGIYVSPTLVEVSLAHTQTIQNSQSSVLKPPEAIANPVN